MPYNVVWYAFISTTNAEAREFFSIDIDTGEILVHYKDEQNVLDRDEGTSTFTIGFRATDNYYGKILMLFNAWKW